MVDTSYKDLIRVPAGKGCILALTPAEYAGAVRCGKSVLRRERLERRLREREAQQANQGEIDAGRQIPP